MLVFRTDSGAFYEYDRSTGALWRTDPDTRVGELIIQYVTRWDVEQGRHAHFEGIVLRDEMRMMVLDTTRVREMEVL